VSGKSIFQLLPAVADAPMPEVLLEPEIPDDVLLRSAVLLLPAPDVLERSAVLLPAPELLVRLAPELLEGEFAPELELLVRS